MRRLLVVACLVAAGVLTEETRCPEHCSCRTEGDNYRTANCTTDVLKVQIPSDLSIDALNIRSHSRGHLKLYPRLFLYLKNVEVLSLRNCSISNMPKDVFLGLNYVVEIDLSYNRIKHLNGIVFSHLTRLRVLRLRGNPLLLNSKNTIYSKSLKKLDMGRCGLRGVSAEQLANLPDLAELLLDGNFLTTLHQGVLPRGIVRLDLSDNRIVNVPTDVLASMAYLRRLDLSDNPVNCTCHLLFLQDNFSRNGITIGDDVVCSFPAELEGKSINRVKEDGPCSDEPILKERHLNQIKYPYSMALTRGEIRNHKRHYAHEAGYLADQPADTAETLFSNSETMAMGTHMEHNEEEHEHEEKDKSEQPVLIGDDASQEELVGGATSSYEEEETTKQAEEKGSDEGPTSGQEEPVEGTSKEKESLEEELVEHVHNIETTSEESGVMMSQEEITSRPEEEVTGRQDENTARQEEFSGDMASEDFTEMGETASERSSEEYRESREGSEKYDGGEDFYEKTDSGDFEVVTVQDIFTPHEHIGKLSMSNETTEAEEETATTERSEQTTEGDPESERTVLDSLWDSSSTTEGAGLSEESTENVSAVNGTEETEIWDGRSVTTEEGTTSGSYESSASPEPTEEGREALSTTFSTDYSWESTTGVSWEGDNGTATTEESWEEAATIDTSVSPTVEVSSERYEATTEEVAETTPESRTDLGGTREEDVTTEEQVETTTASDRDAIVPELSEEERDKEEEMTTQSDGEIVPDLTDNVEETTAIKESIEEEPASGNSSKEEYKGSAAQAKDTTYESLGSYIVIAAIVVLVAGLILLAVCKKKKSSAKIRLANDAESNMGTEMQDMDSLLPKPPENGVKILAKNYGEPNGTVTKEEITPVLQPETESEPEPKQDVNGAVQRATARLTLLPESIPKTPVFIHKPYQD